MPPKRRAKKSNRSSPYANLGPSTSSQVVSLPPQLNVTPTFRSTRIFTATAAASVACTGSEIACALGTICHNTNVAVASFCSSFRIISITAWVAPSLSFDSFASVTFPNAVGNARDEEVVSATPTGVSVSRKLVFKPPAMSLAAEWISVPGYSSSTCAVINCSAGTIIYLDIESTFANTISNITKGIASGVAGNVYYLALDGPTTNNLVPLGLPTTH